MTILVSGMLVLLSPQMVTPKAMSLRLSIDLKTGYCTFKLDNSENSVWAYDSNYLERGERVFAFVILVQIRKASADQDRGRRKLLSTTTSKAVRVWKTLRQKTLT